MPDKAVILQSLSPISINQSINQSVNQSINQKKQQKSERKGDITYQHIAIESMC